MARRALLLSLIAAALAFAPAVAATPPTSASGNETFTSITSTLLRVVDGNSFFANSATGTITTRFEGKGAFTPVPTLAVHLETIAATGGLSGLHLNGTGEQVGATVT